MEEHLLYKQYGGGLIPLCPIITKYTIKYVTKYTTEYVANYAMKYPTKEVIK